MNREPLDTPPETAAAPRSDSVFARAGRFVQRHPLGVVQAILLVLVAIIVLQNVESTSIDILFWSVPALPKLVVIFLSMVLGAVIWEIARRRLR